MSDKLNRKTIFNLMPGLLMREIVVRKLGRLDLGFPGVFQDCLFLNGDSQGNQSCG